MPDEIDWEGRALAAERTMTVLKKRLRAIDAGEEKTIIQRQLESAQRRALEVERRRALTELRSAELERYSTRLEGEVRARTEQVRTMLDHVASGFLLFGRDGVVEPGCSRACDALLGAVDVAGRPLSSLLAWPESTVRAFRLALDQVFDDLLPEEVTLHELPARASLGMRELALSYSVVRADGAITRLLATITDVTAQIEAERAVRHQARLVRILTHREAFVLYLTDARRLMRECSAADPTTDVNFIRRGVHTIKGNSALFGLDELAQLCHVIEESTLIGPGEIEQLAQALRTFLEDNRRVLQIDPDPDRSAVRSYVLTQSIFDKLSDRARARDADEMERLLVRLRQRPANDFVEPIRDAVTRLSERLDKHVDLQIQGAEVQIDPARLSPVLRVLPHLVRNAMDHGIESPEERGDKPARGTLTLAFSDAGDAWEIALSDDGRGIDAAHVLAVAQRRGLLSAEQVKRIPPERALEVLTLEGFSTSDIVTDVSGRGVGLSAVREAAEELGGTLRLDSAVGRGARFTLRIPKETPRAIAV